MRVRSDDLELVPFFHRLVAELHVDPFPQLQQLIEECSTAVAGDLHSSFQVKVELEHVFALAQDQLDLPRSFLDLARSVSFKKGLFNLQVVPVSPVLEPVDRYDKRVGQFGQIPTNAQMYEMIRTFNELQGQLLSPFM